MTTITDKLRRRDFKTKPPQIQPTLKNTIYDYTPTQVKSFELARAKYLDEDYKDGNKAKDFSPAKIDVLEDTGVKNVSGVSFNEDPFGDFFGFKSENVPDRYLDGYYQYNLKGMTNNKFIKDRLLVQGTELSDDSFLAEQEYLELLERQRVLEADIKGSEEDEIYTFFNREKRRLRQEKDTTKEPIESYAEKVKSKKIEVKRAVIERNTKAISEIEPKLKTEVEALKKLGDNDVAKLAELFPRDLPEGSLIIPRIRTANIIFKKYNLPLLKSTMDGTEMKNLTVDNIKIINAKAAAATHPKSPHKTGTTTGEFSPRSDEKDVRRVSISSSAGGASAGGGSGSRAFEKPASVKSKLPVAGKKGSTTEVIPESPIRPVDQQAIMQGEADDEADDEGSPQKMSTQDRQELVLAQRELGIIVQGKKSKVEKLTANDKIVAKQFEKFLGITITGNTSYKSLNEALKITIKKIRKEPTHTLVLKGQSIGGEKTPAKEAQGQE
jgi:hypothetical protein